MASSVLSSPSIKTRLNDINGKAIDVGDVLLTVQYLCEKFHDEQVLEPDSEPGGAGLRVIVADLIEKVSQIQEIANELADEQPADDEVLADGAR